MSYMPGPCKTTPRGRLKNNIEFRCDVEKKLPAMLRAYGFTRIPGQNVALCDPEIDQPVKIRACIELLNQF